MILYLIPRPAGSVEGRCPERRLHLRVIFELLGNSWQIVQVSRRVLFMQVRSLPKLVEDPVQRGRTVRNTSYLSSSG